MSQVAQRVFTLQLWTTNLYPKSHLSAELEEEHEDEDDAEGVEDGGAEEVAEPELEVRRRRRRRRGSNCRQIIVGPS